jgi:hypothetical protein
MTITMNHRQAQELVDFFGGEEANVTVADHEGGLRAWCTDYPEEGSVDLGRLDDELKPGQDTYLRISTASGPDDIEGMNDDAAVRLFAQAMATKLQATRAKGRSGWRECSGDDISRALHEQIKRGDPLDAANLCMFLWSLLKPITPANPHASLNAIGPAAAMHPLSSSEATHTPMVPLTVQVARVESQGMTLTIPADWMTRAGLEYDEEASYTITFKTMPAAAFEAMEEFNGF